MRASKSTSIRRFRSATCSGTSYVYSSLHRFFRAFAPRTIEGRHELPNHVYINATGAFLPGEPVGNDEIEARLGMIGGKPSRARQRILNQNQIKTRHYAVGK